MGIPTLEAYRQFRFNFGVGVWGGVPTLGTVHPRVPNSGVWGGVPIVWEFPP